MSLKNIKAEDRRKKIRGYIKSGWTQNAMAATLGVDVTTISEDVAIIKEENYQRITANKELIKQDVDNLVMALDHIHQLEIEAWKIYSGYREVVAENGDITVIELPMDDRTKLDAWEKIRQCNLDRAKLLKLLNPASVNIEKLSYVNVQIDGILEQIVNLTLQYIPEDKKVEFLEKAKIIDIGENNAK